jgi:hypothetical protein
LYDFGPRTPDKSDLLFAGGWTTAYGALDSKPDKNTCIKAKIEGNITLPEVVRYDIYQDNVKFGESTTTSFTEDTDGTHNYCVVAVYDNDAQSKKVCKSITCTSAPVTDLEVAYNEDCHAVLTWTGTATATYYKIKRGNDVIAPNVTTTNYTDEELNPTQGYTWSVIACSGTSESEPTNVTEGACFVLPAPVTDLAIKFENDCSAGTLTWTATTETEKAIAYNVYKDGAFLAEVELTEEPSYVDIDELEGVKHIWSVKILCNFDTESAPASIEKTCVIEDGIKENGKTTFSILPNPASNNITISAGNNFHTIEVVSFLGQTVLSQPNVGSTVTLDVSNFSNGVYFVRIISDSNTSVKKFVKQ